MLPVNWNPTRTLSRELSSLHREMDELFRRTFGMSGERAFEAAEAETAGLFPVAVNCYIKGNTYFVEAEIPGAERNDLDLSVEGNLLVLRGERKGNREVKDQDYLIRESSFGSFVRRISLPEGADSEKIQAKYIDGVLKVSMPISKTASGRKILIEGSAAEGGKLH